MLGEVPELVDFLFLEDAPDDPDSWQKAIAGDEVAPRILADALAAYETCPWDKDALHEVTLAIAEAVGRKLGKAQAPIRVAVMGRTPGPARCSTRWRCWAATRRAAGWRPRSTRADACPLMLLAPLRWALRIAVLVVAVIVLYFAVTLVQVWLTSRQYDPHPAGAILVMGAAQYDCVPSPDLAARLDQALMLYHQGYAHLIMVTGSKEPGDKCTEAESGAMYLESEGRADDRPSSRRAATTATRTSPTPQPALQAHGATVVLVTTDPFHEDRSMAIASDLALTPSPTPTQTSPITGWSTVPYFVKEAVGVGLGRIIGYNHLEWLHDA